MSDATQERARSEAAAWFARLSRLSVPPATLREFWAWRRDPANAAAYAQVEAGWERAGTLADDPEIRAATAAALEGRRLPRRRGRGAAWPAGIGLVVGGLALGCVLGLGWLQTLPTYRTQVGEQRVVVLEDGSRMRLNTDSAVRVRFSRGERDVTLQRGEAFFEVAHDASRPFVVAADGTRVRAIGTKFDVRRDSEAVAVTLLEGRVRVAGGGGASATLAPNQRLLAKAGALSAPSAADAEAIASWTSGRLVFRATPLADAVAEVNRYSRRKVVLAGDGSVARQPVSGAFDTGDTQAFVAAASALFNLSVATEPGGDVRLSPRS